MRSIDSRSVEIAWQTSRASIARSHARVHGRVVIAGSRVPAMHVSVDGRRPHALVRGSEGRSPGSLGRYREGGDCVHCALTAAVASAGVCTAGLIYT